MTTNVTDLTQWLMASDSRWSLDTEKFMIYADDTGFGKIIEHGRYALMFAGSSVIIQLWKEWLRSSPTILPDIPNPGAVCLVDLREKKLMFERGQDIRNPDVRIAGSGSIHAMACWGTNKDARMAVESAKRSDIFSGGRVRFICANTGEKDVEDVCGADHLNKQVIPMGGLVMYKVPSGETTGSPVAVSEASMKDPEVKQVVARLESGAVALSAPCDGMYNQWTCEETDAFRLALQEMIDNP